MNRVPDSLTARLREARRVVVLTGAGISAESGVPTFRDALTGLWARYDPQELATPEAFQREPKLVWDWYAWRRDLVNKAEPNAGHRALAEMERHIQDFMLITQNVDSLHTRAGSRKVIELHGNLARVKCSADGRLVDNWTEGSDVPRCPHCGARLRPDVVWFGERLPADALESAFDAADRAEVFLTIGTSGLVQPAATLPLRAVEAGALTVEVNPTETPLSAWMDVSVREPAGLWLPALLAATWGDS